MIQKNTVGFPFLFCFILMLTISMQILVINASPNFPHIHLHHPRQVHHETKRRQLASVSDLQNYWHHGSRIGVGADLGRRLPNVPTCVKECDNMGFACAGFIHERFILRKVNDEFVPAEGNCTLVGRGYGLRKTAESDFYRKKTNPEK